MKVKIHTAQPPRAGIVGDAKLPPEWKGHPILEPGAPPLTPEEIEEARGMGLDLRDPADAWSYRNVIEASLKAAAEKKS